MKSLVEEWDKFFKQHPYGGPWDFNKHTKKLQDDHVVDFIKYYNFEKNLKASKIELECLTSKFILNAPELRLKVIMIHWESSKTNLSAQPLNFFLTPLNYEPN